MKLKVATFLIILITAGRLASVSAEIDSFNSRLKKLSRPKVTSSTPKAKARTTVGGPSKYRAAHQDKSANEKAATSKGKRLKNKNLSGPTGELNAVANSQPNRNLVSERGLSILHLVIGCILTAIMFAVLGVCTKESMSSKSSDECGVFGWLGGGIFAALGLKYIISSATSIHKGARKSKRSLKTMNPEEISAIAKTLYDTPQVEKMLSPNSLNKVFKKTMSWIKDEDLKNLNPSDSKGIFKYVRKLLYDKFPNSKKMLSNSIRDVQRLSGYFKK